MRESVPSGVLASVLRPAFIGATIAWALLLPLAPFVAARPHALPLGGAFLFAVYAIGSGICHQLPERSFHLWSHQLPVCARCTGIYIGAAMAVVAAPRLPQRPVTTRRWRAILAAAAAPAGLSLLYEWTTGQMPSHWIRAATGLALGAVVAWMVLSAMTSRIRAENQGKLTAVRATAAEQTQSGMLVLLCVASWAIPGAGHLWLGRRSKGLVFLVALPLMFVIGLSLQGRLFPFDLNEPLVGLAAIADLGIGIPYFIATTLGYGAGEVRAVTYEYGNAFLIVAGLLNLLVVIDAFDVAMGRK